MNNETRSQTIVRHTQAYLQRTSDSWPTLATNVMERYHELVPAQQREVHFKIYGDAYKCARLNAQELRRMESGDIRLPVDLEEAWVQSLPQPWQEQCLTDLAARYGLLAAPIPSTEAGGAVIDFAALLKEIAEMHEALAPAIADGVIDEQDRPLAVRMLKEITDVDAQLLTMRRQINKILDGRPGKAAAGLKRVM